MTDAVVERFEDANDAACAAADAIAAALAQGVQKNGRATFVATGGRTPGPVYDDLARTALPWDQVCVTLTDERWVEPTSPLSNERLVRERLLTGHAAAASFLPLKTEVGFDGCGRAAEVALAQLLPFDAVLLGMGEDGHIASLFPGHPMLEDGLDPASNRLALAVPAGDPAPAEDRVSLTLAALLTARRVIVLTSGEAKLHMLQGEGAPIHALFRHATSPVRVLWSP